MYSSAAQPRTFSDLSRTSYVDVGDDLNDNVRQSRSFEHQDADDEDEDDGERDEQDDDMMDHDDLGYDEYDEEIDADESDEEEDVDFNGNASLGAGDSRLVPSKIIEPPEFVLSLAVLLEDAHDILEPLDDPDDDDNEGNEQVPIGRHVLSDVQRELHLQKLSLQVLNSLGNCSATQKNDRLDDALKLASLLLGLYFPPPLDPSTLDLRTNTPIFRELSPPRPPPLIFLTWLNKNDQDPDQGYLVDVLHFSGNSALHTNFWPLLQKLALRCRLDDFKHLIDSPAWESTNSPQPGARAYPRSAAPSLKRAAQMIHDIATSCPALRFFPTSKNAFHVGKGSKRSPNSEEDNWDTGCLVWRMWRTKVARAIDEIRRMSQPDPNSVQSEKPQGEGGAYFRSRKQQGSNIENSNLIPFEIAQELRIILQIFIGDRETILRTSENWLEAVGGLAAFYDESGSTADGVELTVPGWQSSTRATNAYREHPNKKMARYFRMVTDRAFPLPAVRNFQTAVADVLAGRIPMALKYLSKKSLVVASATAEIFAWGGLLQADLTEKNPSVSFGDNVMGILDQNRPQENVREAIVSEYAMALAGLGVIHKDETSTVEGWELGLTALRRVNTTGAHKAASKLVRSVDLDVKTPERVERLVNICIAQGFEEERKYVSETFAQILLAHGQVGSSLLYFSRAECSSKIHSVMADYVRDSLRLGELVPSDEELDETLQRLLRSPVELAEDDILRREFSGFAASRNYFASKVARQYESAARTLLVLLLSSGENIDGGILHAEWESVLVPTNIAGIVYELLSSYESENSGQKIHEYLTSGDMFNFLGVLESLFLIGGQTLEAIQEEFVEVLHSRRDKRELDFVDAVFKLRTAFARGIGSEWLKEESSKLR